MKGKKKLAKESKDKPTKEEKKRIKENTKNGFKILADGIRKFSDMKTRFDNVDISRGSLQSQIENRQRVIIADLQALFQGGSVKEQRKFLRGLGSKTRGIIARRLEEFE